jgi:hypothetical protein
VRRAEKGKGKKYGRNKGIRLLGTIAIKEVKK